MQKRTELLDLRLASITNPKHHAILEALRDTDLSVPAIAKKLKVTKRVVYYVIERYLPGDFLSSRHIPRNDTYLPSSKAKDENKDNGEDLVIIVPPKKNVNTDEEQCSNSSNENTALTESSISLPTTDQISSTYELSSTSESNLSKSESEKAKNKLIYPSTLTIESSDFKLQWIGASPEYSNDICMVLNALQKKIREL